MQILQQKHGDAPALLRESIAWWHTRCSVLCATIHKRAHVSVLKEMRLPACSKLDGIPRRHFRFILMGIYYHAGVACHPTDQQLSFRRPPEQIYLAFFTLIVKATWLLSVGTSCCGHVYTDSWAINWTPVHRMKQTAKGRGSWNLFCL